MPGAACAYPAVVKSLYQQLMTTILKGMFANPRTFSMICAHLNCSLWNGHSSCVARCTSRIAHCANPDFRSPGGNMNCPSRIPTCWCTFLNCKWFSKVRVTSQFSFFIFVFSADPGDGYIPRRRALDAENCKYHENSLCACLNGMYPSQEFTFFSRFFFQKKNGWEHFESP